MCDKLRSACGLRVIDVEILGGCLGIFEPPPMFRGQCLYTAYTKYT